MISSAIGTNLRSKISKKEVTLHDIQPSESIGSSANGKVCLVCSRNKSAYCCPQCYIPYCSAKCYSEHGIDCTETFSRQRVKTILDLESKESQQSKENKECNKVKANAGSNQSVVSYGDFTKENEFDQNVRNVRNINAGGEEGDTEDEDDSHDNLSIIENDLNTLRVTSVEGEVLQLDQIDLRDIEKMPPRALARLVKLWTPWWTMDHDPQDRASSLLAQKKRGSAVTSFKSYLLSIASFFCHRLR